MIHIGVLIYKYKKTFSKSVGMEVPKSTETRCRDSRITKLNIHSLIPTSFSHITAGSAVALIYTVCHVSSCAGVAFHTDYIHSPCNKIRVIYVAVNM